jgi:Mrp family chromosome partitioning ATPase
MRPAAGAGIEPVHQVVMPAARLAMPAFGEGREAAETAVGADGELTVRDAAARLIEENVSRAIFLSPEGDDGAATSILVAREISDAGLRVLLLDLTETGAVSQATLESSAYAGITNLLSSEAQFTDVIHADLYSDSHIMPVGTADPERAMRAADRLPIILNSLTTAYDIVVVECGAADPESIRRLVSDGSLVLVSVIEPVDGNVAEITAGLEAGGYKDFLLVTPAGHEPSYPPQPGRSAA